MPVEVEGIVGLRKALNKFTPDLKKQMDAEVRAALKPIIADARAHVPGKAPGRLFNWNDPGYIRESRTSRQRGFPSYDSRSIRRGLTYSLAASRPNRLGFVSVFSLFNKNAAGAIIETAGRKNPSGDPRSQSNNPNAGANFIGSMNGIGALKDYKGQGNRKDQGRLLFAAYDRNQGKALDGTMKAIDKALRMFAHRAKAEDTTVRAT
jgi:hypothetical protein